MIWRCVSWTLRGRGGDAQRLARGWWEAYVRFIGPRL